MKRQFWITGLLALVCLLVIAPVSAQNAGEVTFTVRVENISGQGSASFKSVGIFAKPVGADSARPAMPTEAYEFTFKAQPGDYVSFATMYGESNDTFFAPAEAGIALFDDAGNPVNGDVSDQVMLWDAGTEVNEPLGQGPNQAPRQPAPNTGEAEGGSVQQVAEGGEFPTSPNLMSVTLTALTLDTFRLRLDNISGDDPVPTGFSPGVFVVHSADQSAPLFTTGQADRGQGLERIAEDGNPEELGLSLAGSAANDVGASPLVYVVNPADLNAPFFNLNEPDRGQGLERLAEDGNPEPLSMSLEGISPKAVGIVNTAVGASEPGPLMPGQAFEFDVTLSPEDRLWVAFMFGQSNDLVFAPDENGIALFMANGQPVSGSITGAFGLWDAGTEVNEEPFAGANQAPRQAAPDTGTAEGGVVQPVVLVADGFNWPSVLSSIRVTVTPHTDMMAEATEAPMMEATAEMTPEMTPGS